MTKHLRLTLSVLLPAILSSQFAWADEAPTPQQPFNAPTEADVKTKAQENEKALRMDPAIVDAIQLLKQDKEDEARKTLEGELKRDASNVDLVELLALLEFKGGSYSNAAKHLRVALLDAEKKKDIRKQLILQKRIGDCYYNDAKVDQALACYNAALALSESVPEDDCWRPLVLESLMGCWLMKKDITKAEEAGVELVRVSNIRAKSGRPDDLISLLWSLIQLMDLYRTTGNDTKRLPLREQALDLFDKFMAAKAPMELNNQFPPLELWKRYFASNFVKENAPTTVPEYLWLAKDFKLRTLPLVAWMPEQANGQKPTPKAVILCIHGLGLDNSSYLDFARKMSKRGFGVFAMDVRGFGAWVSAPGHENVQFERTISDVGYFVKLIKERHNGIPVFLLGESMGGAIALRAAARYPDDLKGVVSSVPSAEQFQGRIMAMKVAYHFIQDPKRPFYVGEMLAEKATSRSELQAAWKADPKAKMNLTPLELMKFAVFMRTTESDCKLIKSMPVFVVQGLKDKLVKPHGTYQLFDAVTSDDKNMMIIGNAEHLIFETDQQSETLLDALDSWLHKHIQGGS
ncbi:MAG: alpha/beta fold hydrolase [Candidatus Obscuribacterales bacterium]|nr:alpha/beta fold hydrolase [Candidatus Obscuribacterales bacterium]